MKRKKIFSTITECLIFFLCIVIVSTISIIIYIHVKNATENSVLIVIAVVSNILILSIIATFINYIRKRILIDKPVAEILSATNKISHGDFKVRLKIKHSYYQYNQFDYIKDNLNKMTEELSKVEVLHNDFVSNVSHEIKTPVAIIQNYTTALQDESLDEETREKYIDTLLSTSKRLTNLVSNILKLNRLENQVLTPEYEKFRLDEQLAQCILGYEELIEQKNINLECDIQEGEFYSCPNYLEIVWNNLLSNAIKFTENDGTIKVTLSFIDDKAIVSVSDSGCGISKEVGEHIFDKFYQGETSHSKEGNGLGLALVKKVIDVIGGEISVDSKLGVGTTFKVTLKDKHNE